MKTAGWMSYPWPTHVLTASSLLGLNSRIWRNIMEAGVQIYTSKRDQWMGRGQIISACWALNSEASVLSCWGCARSRKPKRSNAHFCLLSSIHINLYGPPSDFLASVVHKAKPTLRPLKYVTMENLPGNLGTVNFCRDCDSIWIIYSSFVNHGFFVMSNMRLAMYSRRRWN